MGLILANVLLGFFQSIESSPGNSGNLSTNTKRPAPFLGVLFCTKLSV